MLFLKKCGVVIMPALGPYDLLNFNEGQEDKNKVYIKINKYTNMVIVKFVDANGKALIDSTNAKVLNYYGEEPEQLDKTNNPLGRRLHKSNKVPFPWGEVTMLAAKKKKDGQCLDSWIIGASYANKGWGPLLYDILLQIAGKRGLTTDRGLVSPDAVKVWMKYFDERSDILKKPLDPIAKPGDIGQLTPKIPEDDCVSSHALRPTWNSNVENPETNKKILSVVNYVYYGMKLKTIQKLEKLNLIWDNILKENIIDKVREFILEGIGDHAGNDKFAGTGNFGRGGYKQLAINLPDPDLTDPNDPDAATSPDFGMNHLAASPDEYEEHPHLLPHEDYDLENGKEPLVVENPINDPARGAYRDLPGFPRMNTLVNGKKFIPDDQDQDRVFPEYDENLALVRDKLVPDGKDQGTEPEYFGYGPLDDTGLMQLQRTFGEELNLQLQGNPSINNWKTTTRQNMGKIKQSVNYNQLVEPHDFQEDLPGADKGKHKNLKDKNDVVYNRPGTMGVLVAPVNKIPQNLKNESKDDDKDDVEKMIDSLNPARHKGSGEKTLTSPEDFHVNLENIIWEK